jgi:hypothetical protein
LVFSRESLVRWSISTLVVDAAQSFFQGGIGGPGGVKRKICFTRGPPNVTLIGCFSFNRFSTLSESSYRTKEFRRKYKGEV